MYVLVYIHTPISRQQPEGWLTKNAYGVATISRLLKIIGLFCKRAL